MTAKKPKTQRAIKPTHKISSGNVFADLGLPDAQERLTKAMLAHQIAVLVEGAGLNQAKPTSDWASIRRFPNLLHGRLALFQLSALCISSPCSARKLY